MKRFPSTKPYLSWEHTRARGTLKQTEPVCHGAVCSVHKRAEKIWLSSTHRVFKCVLGFRWVTAFRNSGSTKHKWSPGWPHTIWTSHNIETVGATVQQSPCHSACKQLCALWIPHTFLHIFDVPHIRSWYFLGRPVYASRCLIFLR